MFLDYDGLCFYCSQGEKLGRLFENYIMMACVTE